jgi:hypothetical protein
MLKHTEETMFKVKVNKIAFHRQTKYLINEEDRKDFIGRVQDILAFVPR